MFYRFLADFKIVNNGTSGIFGNDFPLYWGILGLLVTLFFLFLVIKYFCINIALLKASEANHKMMLDSVVRCPSNFFDKTPSGILINNFSNDLGIIDNLMIFALLDSFEGPSVILIAVINVCEINVFYTIPAVIIILMIVLFFRYSQ